MTRLKEFNVTITYPYQSRPAKEVVVQGINFPDAEATARNLFGGNARCTGEHKPKKMKTFREFNEAVSAVRLAQLAAKGKGAAAAAKMSVDGLKGAKTASKATSAARKALPAASSTGGGALVKSPTTRPGGSKAGNIVKSALKTGAEAAVQGALAKRPSNPGALAKTGKVTPASGVADEKQAPGPGPRDGRPTFGDKVKEKAYKAKKHLRNKVKERLNRPDKDKNKGRIWNQGKSGTAGWADGQDYSGADRAKPK